MDFNKISNEELNLRLEKLARTERKITHVILLHLNEVESRGLHLKMGFESLYAYLVKALHYSESAAYRRIQAARLLKAVPDISAKIETGALNLSHLTQVQKCLKEEKKKGVTVSSQKLAEVLATMESKSTFESEKILATEFNHLPKTQAVAKPQKDNSVRMEITLSQEQFECLKQAQSLLSHQCPEGSWAEVITQLARKFNKSRMGKVACKENKNKNKNKNEKESEEACANQDLSKHQEHNAVKLPRSNTATKRKISVPFAPYRPTISVKIRRYLLTKAQHTCEYRDLKTGRRCSAKHQLEADHVRPLALGGEHKIENLRIICRAHNQMAAKNSGLRRPQ